MERIAPVEPPYEAKIAEDFAKLMPPGMDPIRLFRVLGKNPRVLRRIRRGGLLDPGSITVRERQIVILRTTGRCRSEYEWGVHVSFFAAVAGLSPEQVASTATGGPADDVWDESERLLLRLADELHDRAAVSDELWESLAARWSDAQLLELVVLAGLYHAISFVTNGARIELEPGAPRFPVTA